MEGVLQMGWKRLKVKTTITVSADSEQQAFERAYIEAEDALMDSDMDLLEVTNYITSEKA